MSEILTPLLSSGENQQTQFEKSLINKKNVIGTSIFNDIFISSVSEGESNSKFIFSNKNENYNEVE